MSHFNQLHPALQHHIVSLGWPELHPIQEAAIPPILAGHHQVILAPTAGGKTEAALFPVMSRMLSEDWQGLSTLYICPTKALLNNLEGRLDRSCKLVGLRSAVWHGDVSDSDRRGILLDPPDCLLTTPESLEAMLVSPRPDRRLMLRNLKVVIVDEIHSFAGDDRGWHLLAVLERLTQLAGKELQRIGLSATIGNPDALLRWLTGSCRHERGVLQYSDATPAATEVQIDYVGNLSNAAKVIAGLHHGEKRLVFVNSRAQAEELGVFLKELEVTTFVTHSSLSQHERGEAEKAFAEGDNCVIVATSVLELGVDVGSLDRVIQIDCPFTVASFLQRMGRTGRRPGSVRNCLFLTTNGPALLQATALVALAEQGFVEPVEPPVEPFHVLAQQLMAVTLQESGIGRNLWMKWVSEVPAFAKMTNDLVQRIVDWMVEKKILWSEEGILAIDQHGEASYGHRHFLKLLSVFTTPPLFKVIHGRRELGSVDEITFIGKHDNSQVLLLGGNAWRVKDIDWKRRVTHVEPSDDPGRSLWEGIGRGLSEKVAQAMKRRLLGQDLHGGCTERARNRMIKLRKDFAWLAIDGSTIRRDGSKWTWWTLAGQGANACLASGIEDVTHAKAEYDALAVYFASDLLTSEVLQSVRSLQDRPPETLLPKIAEDAIRGIKFFECLPTDIATQILQHRLQDANAVRRVLLEAVHFVEVPIGNEKSDSDDVETS